MSPPPDSTQLQQALATAVAGASDVRDAYRAAVRAIATALDFEIGAAWEIDDDTVTLRCVALWRREDAALEPFARQTESLALTLGEGLPGRVWERRQPLWLTDFAIDEALPRHGAARQAGLHAAVCFPVQSERGLVGVLELLGNRPLEPDQSLLAAFELLGSQLGQLVERRQAEAASHAVQQRHRATLEAALDCVITMDHRGRVLEFNPAAERTFGYCSDEAVGKDMAELIVPPELREAHRSGLARLLAGGDPHVLDRRIEIDATRADGSRLPVELTITRIDVPGPPTFTGHVRDISDRKLAEEQLRASRARIVEAADSARRKIERDLHDGAQQLLISATMNLRAARERLDHDPELAAALLDELAVDLANAVDQLRELARGIHPAVLTDGGIGPALRGLVRRSAVPAVVVSAPAERFSAQIESTAYFVVAEALTNAARYANASLVEIEVLTEDGGVRVQVRDDGIGGAEWRGGLRGLSDRVAALDGSFDVWSPGGGGTTITAVLPAQAVPAGSPCAS